MNSSISIPEGTMCHLHPSVPAVQICQICKKPTCKTCDFAFPVNIHVCPNCVNKPLTLSPRQKKNLAWSYVMAATATFGYFITLFIAAVLGSNLPRQISGLVLMLVILGPSITGISLAINARTRNRKKPISIWVALIWNSLVMGIFLVLILVGNLTR